MDLDVLAMAMLVEVRGKMKTKVGREARLSHVAQARVCYCMRSQGKLGMSKSQTAVFQALDAMRRGFSAGDAT